MREKLGEKIEESLEVLREVVGKLGDERQQHARVQRGIEGGEGRGGGSGVMLEKAGGVDA